MIIVVTGLPRSGTSMMMRMLMAGGVALLFDAFRKPDEDNPDGYYEYRQVRDSSQGVSWVGQAEGKAVKVISRLLRYLPPDKEYHVIFMRRAIRETVASQNRMLARLGRQECGQPWSDDMWASRLAEEVRSACQWIRSRPDMRLHEIDYNRLLADPGPELRGLAGFLPVPVDVDAMREVINPRLYRQREC